MEEAKTPLVGEELGVDLYDLFYLFRQKLPGILLSMVLGGLLVGLFTWFFIAPTYEATAKLYIVSSSSDSVVNLTDLQIGTSLTADYEELVLSRPMLESVLNNLQLDMETDTLAGMIRVSNPNNTRILRITATSTNPEDAMNIANEIARLSVDWLPEIMRSSVPSVPEEAVLPQEKAGPSYILNTLIGALAFMAVYYGLAVIRYVHDDSIRTAEDLERYFDLVPLTSVPEEKGVYARDEKSSKTRKRKGVRQA